MAEVKFANIQWIRNSPYGGYTAGDFLDFYIDNSAFTFVVKENNVTITSGNDVPVTFVFPDSGIPQNQDYYKSETYFDVVVCDGLDKMKFERISAFPYFKKIELIDHPSCSLTPVVCDLRFDVLPTITNASSDTATDGQISATATSSNAIKYRLNQDFRYSDATGQTSSTFTGLGKGNYLIFARDEKNCLAVISATVGVSYTYGVRFRLEYYSIHSNLHQKTEILEKSYSGNVEIVKGTETPTTYSLRGEGEKDKFVPILAGEISFNLISETIGQFYDLFTNDPEKFRIKQSIDYGSGYETAFLGKVEPNQYQQNYVYKADVNILATDGLARLEDVPFLDSEGNRFSGQYKQITIIAYILGRIGLGLSIRSGCNLYASSMNTTATDDPLDQAYVNVLRYYLKSETPSMKDVLRMILEPYGAQIIQWGGYWNILRVEERVNDFDYRVYSSTGAYQSNSNYDPVKDLKQRPFTNRLVWADRNQILTMEPGFGSLRLIYDLGNKDNLLYNGDFSMRRTAGYGLAVVDGVYGSSYQFGNHTTMAPDMSGFEIVSNGAYVTKNWETIKDENVALTLVASDSGAYVLSETISLKMSNTDRLRFKYVFAIDPSVYFSPFWIKVKVQVRYGDYYLLDDGTWTTTQSSLAFFIKPEQFYKYQTLEIVADSPDSTYIDGESIYVKMDIPYITDYDYASLSDLRDVITTTLKEGYRVSALSGGTIYYYELKNNTDAETGTAIVRPDDYHATTNPYQWISQDSRLLPTAGSYKFKIDKVQIEFLNGGRELPQESIISHNMENGNNLSLSRKIYHGSVPNIIYTQQNFGEKVLVETGKYLYDYFVSIGIAAGFYRPGVSLITQSAEAISTAYLSNSSGNGFNKWTRTNLASYGTLEDIFIQMYAYQYRQAWRKLQGSFIADIAFSPIDTMRETMDSNRKYYPVSLDIDFKADSYNAEFLELSDVEDAAAFSTAFSLAFDA